MSLLFVCAVYIVCIAVQRFMWLVIIIVYRLTKYIKCVNNILALNYVCVI